MGATGSVILSYPPRPTSCPTGRVPKAVAFDCEECRRLPLAGAALRLLDFVTDDACLADLFACHRGRWYEDIIRFPLFVHRVADSLLGHRESAHPTVRPARADGPLAASVEAMAGKRQRVLFPLSRAVFAEATARLETVLPVGPDTLPASAAGFRVLAFNGKKVKQAVQAGGRG